MLRVSFNIVLVAILKNNIIKRVFILVLLFSLHGCVMDFIDVCQIENNSTSRIQVTVSFDKHYLDSSYSHYDYRYITQSNGFAQDSGVTLINFDTLNLTLRYMVLPKTQFTLARGVWLPDEFKEITIIGKDVITLNNKQKIKNTFKKINGKYVLAID